MKRPNIEDIEARASAATPGPWKYGEREGSIVAANDVPIIDAWGQWAAGYGVDWEREEDRVFVRHAREDIDALVAYIKHIESGEEPVEFAPLPRRPSPIVNRIDAPATVHLVQTTPCGNCRSGDCAICVLWRDG